MAKGIATGLGLAIWRCVTWAATRAVIDNDHRLCDQKSIDVHVVADKGRFEEATSLRLSRQPHATQTSKQLIAGGLSTTDCASASAFNYQRVVLLPCFCVFLFCSFFVFFFFFFVFFFVFCFCLVVLWLLW